MKHVQSLTLALALTLAVAASSVVAASLADPQPVIPLRDMAPEHACYFICNICMEGGPVQDLMDCVNNVCARIPTGATCGPVLDLNMMWLGHRCPHFSQVMESMGPAHNH
ncbi:uncharacterized protein LOC143281144 [Babylonia areolata]|uniref:uncharacterized protein LOC143281144 n=1 Tax=Babylonia areolata TaxID=304850 RepID=UPI003FD67305